MGITDFGTLHIYRRIIKIQNISKWEDHRGAVRLRLTVRA